MAYVVKAMCYVDSEGYGVPNLKGAKRYKSKEMAELAAYVSNGEEVGRYLAKKTTNWSFNLLIFCRTYFWRNYILR